MYSQRHLDQQMENEIQVLTTPDVSIDLSQILLQEIASICLAL